MSRAAYGGKPQTPYNCLRRQMAWPTTVVSVAILTLAILNPLLCILHCSLSAHRSTIHDDNQQPFLCNLARETRPSAAPFTLVWSGPRAVYEALPIFAVSLAPITLIVIAITVVWSREPQHIPRPSSPPPKLQLNSNLA